MAELSNNEYPKKDYEQIIASYSDDELSDVLKKRKLYQKEAAEFAVQEAIRRGLIYSEQDLFASEYQHKPERFSIFPTIENERIKNKYVKSILRTFLIIGVIPVVYGGIRIIESLNVEAVLMFLFGATWSIATFQLKKTLNVKTVYLLLVLLVLAVAFLIRYFVLQKSIYSTDVLFSVTALGIIFYLVGFLQKLIK